MLKNYGRFYTKKIIMAFNFGKTSKRRMQGVDERLIRVFELALSRSKYDFGIAWMGGLRKDSQQNRLYKEGKSQLDGYNKRSKHQPSLEDGKGKALDIIVFDEHGQLTWDEFYIVEVSHCILEAAEELCEELRWGNDWDRDGIPVDMDPDERFVDMPHFELFEKKS